MTDIRTPVLDHATRLQAIWESFVTSTSAALDARSTAQAALVDIAPDRAYALSKWDVTNHDQQVFSSLVDLLISFLRGQLARQGYSPIIELDEAEIYGQPPDFRSFVDNFTGSSGDSLLEFSRVRIAYAGTRSLLEIANNLLEQFTPANARAAALSQAATHLDQYFRPSRDSRDPIVDRGRVKVMSRYLGTYSSNPWEMTHGARTLIHEVVQHIRLLLTEVGLPEAVQASHALSMTLATGSYSSRQCVPCGPGLTLVFFKGRIEYHFQPAVLDALQIAIAEAKQAAAA